MGKSRIGHGVEVEYFPSDARMENYSQFKDSFWAGTPEQMHDAVGHMFSSGAAGVNPLSWMLSKFPKKVLTRGYDWTWDMMLPPPPARAIERLEPSGVAGKYLQPFKLKLNTPAYNVGEILSPGVSGPNYQVRILKPAIQHGNGYVYEVLLVTNDQNLFLPDRYLESGTEWRSVGSSYADGSMDGANVQFGSLITLKDTLGMCRMRKPVSGMIGDEPIMLHIEGELGMHHVWADRVQLEMFKEFARKKEFMLILGKSASHHVDTNGNPVRYCTSLREKLEGSNIEIYNRLTARMLYDFIADAMKGNLNLDQHRSIVCYTGIWGMEEINRALREELLKATGGVAIGDHFISNASNNKYNPNSLVFGGQFTEYHLPINVTLRVEWMPLYDDTRLNSDIDPMTGHPIESMRMTFLDVTGDNGVPNIQLVTHKDGQMFNFIPGLKGPHGITPMGQAAHGGSFFEYVMEEHVGIHIRDVSRCGELIYALA